MNRLLFIFIIFSIFTSSAFSDDINEYQIIKIKDIQVGKKEELIGWEPAIAGGFSGPTSFAITNDDKIYIPDRVNYRINVYDLNFNFIKEIVEEGKKLIPFSSDMKVDENGNIVSYIKGFGLKKIDINGKEIFTKSKNSLSKQINQYRNFFPLGDYILSYNDLEEIECINNSGIIEDASKTLIRLQEISKDKKQLRNDLSGTIKVPDEKKQIIETLRNSKKYLLAGDNFYSANFRKNREYFEQIKDIREYVKSEKSILRSGIEKKKIEINLDDYGTTFLDYDNEHNGYWLAGKQEGNDTRNLSIIIFSKYGEILDAFYYGQYYKNEPNLELYPTSGAEVAVAPSGDVYFLVGNKEKYTLYKVERRW